MYNLFGQDNPQGHHRRQSGTRAPQGSPVGFGDSLGYGGGFGASRPYDTERVKPAYNQPPASMYGPSPYLPGGPDPHSNAFPGSYRRNPSYEPEYGFHKSGLERLRPATRRRSSAYRRDSVYTDISLDKEDAKSKKSEKDREQPETKPEDPKKESEEKGKKEEPKYPSFPAYPAYPGMPMPMYPGFPMGMPYMPPGQGAPKEEPKSPKKETKPKDTITEAEQALFDQWVLSQIYQLYTILPREYQVALSSLSPKTQKALYLYIHGAAKEPPAGLNPEFGNNLKNFVAHRKAQQYAVPHDHTWTKDVVEEDESDLDELSLSEVPFEDLSLDEQLDRLWNHYADGTLEENELLDDEEVEDTFYHENKKYLKKYKKAMAQYRKQFLYDYLMVNPARLKSQKVTVAPPVDIIEFQDEYLINLTLPGIKKSDVEIIFDFRRHTLIISGTIPGYPEEYRSCLRVCERPVGKFERIIPLPPSPRIDDKSIMTSYQDGILCLRVPKYSDDLNQIVIPLKQ